MKIGAFLFAICLLGLSIGTVASAGECRVVVEDLRVTSETVDLPVRIMDAEKIGSCDLILTFNPSSFIVTDITAGDFDTTIWNLETADSGQVRIGGFQTTSDGLDGEVLVATIVFERVGEDSTPINIQVKTLKDATPACNPIPYTIENGRLFTGGSDYIGSRGYGDLPISTHSINTTEVTRRIPLIEAGREASVIFRDMVISMITILTEEDLRDIALSLQEFDGKPPVTSTPDAIPYAYFEIEADGLNTADVKAGISFRVPQSWIDENKIDAQTILLNRYNGGWISLPTVRIDDDDEFITFKSETSEFSCFVITGERMESTGQVESSIEADRSDTVTSRPTPMTGEAGATPAQPASLSWSYVLLAVIGTILVCGAIFLVISRRRR
ncbi:MAG: PGF-pre-PGF domain-containing protein [Candidatus Syntrophoarchaeum sp.]|nr:PGF-pre-PGF domain-containing protein [Candidatus Syntrophoarchaeum sp.]